MLGHEADLVVECLEVEGAIAEASSGAKFRNQTLAGSMVLWSRSWLCRSHALHAVECGDYVAAIPLVRAAADVQAAMVYLLNEGADEWTEWLANGGIAQSAEHHATEFVLHPFRAAEVLAADPVIGPIYRISSDLTLPHFGASLLLAAADSAPGKVAPTFADRDFHLGLAEIILGWLALLGDHALATLETHPETFAPDPGGRLPGLRSSLKELGGRPDRARIELLETPEGSRYLVSGWRRTAGARASRILL